MAEMDNQRSTEKPPRNMPKKDSVKISDPESSSLENEWWSENTLEKDDGRIGDRKILCQKMNGKQKVVACGSHHGETRIDNAKQNTSMYCTMPKISNQQNKG